MHCRRFYHTLEQARKLAEAKGGKCLSEEYVNNRTKMKWECDKGHVWKACFGHVKNSGTWCPACSGNALGTLEQARKFAENRGGECLNEESGNAPCSSPR